MIGALIGLGMGAYGAYQGAKNNKKANDLNERAMRQRELEYNQRAPMRRQGMQALGQVEAPIDMGTIGYNAANPFAAARGPAASTASLGDWGRMTTSPEQIDNALGGANQQQLQDARDAMAATYIGKSDGKMRFASSPGGREYTNADRQRAMQVLAQYDQQVGTRNGVQPLGRR